MTTYLVVAAHPDDADFGVAGTAARLAREGHDVHYLVLTSGEAGAEDPAIPIDTLIATREAEQDAAGRVLGLAGVHYLRLPDGELEASLAVRRQVVREIRRLRPRVVMAPDPRTLFDDDGTYLNHPDHRAAGQVALDAAFPAAGNPCAYRELLAEGLTPSKVHEVWLYFVNAAHANHWVDISDTLDFKIRALECHVSQIGDWASSGGLRREITRWAADEAEKRGLGYRYAEAFQRVVLVREDEGQRPLEAEILEAQSEDGAAAGSA